MEASWGGTSHVARVHVLPAIVVPRLTGDVPNGVTEHPVVPWRRERKYCRRMEEVKLAGRKERLKVGAENEASGENAFIFWHRSNFIPTPTSPPPSSMHNAFLRHWRRRLSTPYEGETGSKVEGQERHKILQMVTSHVSQYTETHILRFLSLWGLS